MSDPAQTGEWAAAFDGLAPSSGPWGSYVARRAGCVVGGCAFKGPPDAEVWVEIAYITLIPARGSGVATAMAAALIGLARTLGVSRICAHTLPEANPSTRVLAANGFAFAGPAVDPDEGPVWRWELAL